MLDGEALPAHVPVHLEALGLPGSFWPGFEDGAVQRDLLGRLANALPAEISPRGSVAGVTADMRLNWSRVLRQLAEIRWLMGRPGEQTATTLRWTGTAGVLATSAEHDSVTGTHVTMRVERTIALGQQLSALAERYAREYANSSLPRVQTFRCSIRPSRRSGRRATRWKPSSASPYRQVPWRRRHPLIRPAG